jgi:hypothetical protein
MGKADLLPSAEDSNGGRKGRVTPRADTAAVKATAIRIFFPCSLLFPHPSLLVPSVFRRCVGPHPRALEDPRTAGFQWRRESDLTDVDDGAQAMRLQQDCARRADTPGSVLCSPLPWHSHASDPLPTPRKAGRSEIARRQADGWLPSRAEAARRCHNSPTSRKERRGHRRAFRAVRRLARSAGRSPKRSGQSCAAPA